MFKLCHPITFVLVGTGALICNAPKLKLISLWQLCMPDGLPEAIQRQAAVNSIHFLGSATYCCMVCHVDHLLSLLPESLCLHHHHSFLSLLDCNDPFAAPSWCMY